MKKLELILEGEMALRRGKYDKAIDCFKKTGYVPGFATILLEHTLDYSIVDKSLDELIALKKSDVIECIAHKTSEHDKIYKMFYLKKIGKLDEKEMEEFECGLDIQELDEVKSLYQVIKDDASAWRIKSRILKKIKNEYGRSGIVKQYIDMYSKGSIDIGSCIFRIKYFKDYGRLYIPGSN